MTKIIYKLTFIVASKFTDKAVLDKMTSGDYLNLQNERNILPSHVIATDLTDALDKVKAHGLKYHVPYDLSAQGEGIIL